MITAISPADRNPPQPPNAVVPQRPAAPQPQEQELNLIRMAIRFKTLLILSVCFGCAASYFVFRSKNPIFESRAQILVTKLAQNVPLRDEGEGNARPDVGTQSVLIRSQRIVKRAVETFDLKSLPSLAHDHNPVNTIIRGLNVIHQPGTEGVLNMSYSGPVADDCRTILNAVIQSYGGFLRENHKSFTEETAQLITNAKDDLLQQLNEKEAEYRKFRKETPEIWSGDSKTNIHRLRLVEIEEARSKLLLERSQTEAELRSLEVAAKSADNRAALEVLVGKISAAADKTSTAFADKLYPLLAEEQQLKATFGPDHPNVRAIRKRIEFTKGFLNEAGITPGTLPAEPVPDVVATYLQSLRQQFKVNQEKETGLNVLFEKETASAKQFVDVEAKDMQFRNEIARMQDLFDAVVHRLGEITLRKDFGGYNMDLLTAPTGASHIAPLLSQHLSAGAMLGSVFGLALAFWREKANTRFVDLEDIRRHLGLPVIGSIPFMRREKIKPKKGSKLDTFLCGFHAPQSAYAEAFRAVRVALYFTTQVGTQKVIQITSPNQSEGKSTISSNIAVAIANSGKRTLLVEADFRRPRVNQILGIQTRIGVPAYLRGAARLDEVIHQTEVQNLWCAPCGDYPDNPAELLTSVQFDDFIETVRDQYDFVIIDSPPVLAVSDAASVASRVDCVLVALHLTNTSRKAAGRAVEALVAVGANLVGVIVNGADAKEAYGYGYKYGNYQTSAAETKPALVAAPLSPELLTTSERR